MSIPVFVPTISRLQAIPSNNISHVDDFLRAIWGKDLFRLCLEYQGIKFSQLSLRSLVYPISLKPEGTLRKRVADSARCNGWEALEDEFSPSWPADKIHVYVYVDQGSVMSAAENLHERMWGQNINGILEEITDPEGVTWEYVPKRHIDTLELNKLGCPQINALLVRPEYKNALESFDYDAAIERQCGGVVVTGQPGIGKTCFLYYLLLHLLSQEIPVALQIHLSTILVFYDCGVDKHRPETDTFPSGTWAIFRSNKSTEQPCASFRAASMQDRAWIVQTAAPLENRWIKWQRHDYVDIFVMDHPSIKEVAALGQILDLDIDNMRRIYKQWGPSAQTCIQLTRDTTAEARHEAAVTLAASQFVKDADFIGECFHERTPHVLLSISPRKENRQIPTADIATDQILSIISYAVADAGAQEQINFYHDLSKGTMFRASAEKILKRFVLTWLSSDLAPLLCVPVNPLRLKIPTCGENNTLCGHLASLKSMQLTADNLPFCFLPVPARGPQTLAGVDAIILTTNSIMTIQVTTSDQYSANEGDFTEIEKHLPTITTTNGKINGNSLMRCHSHVLITDDEQKAKTLRRQTSGGTPDLTKVYTAVFKFGEFKVSSEQMRTLDEARRHAEENTTDVDQSGVISKRVD